MFKIKKVSELFDYNSLKNEEKFIDVIEKLNEEYDGKMMVVNVEYESGQYSKGKVRYEKKKDFVTFYYGYMMYEDHGDYHEFEIHQKDATFKQRLEFCIDKGTKKLKITDVCIVYKFGDYIGIAQEVYEYDDTVKKIIKIIIETINELRNYKLID